MNIKKYTKCYSKSCLASEKQIRTTSSFILNTSHSSINSHEVFKKCSGMQCESALISGMGKGTACMTFHEAGSQPQLPASPPGLQAHNFQNIYTWPFLNAHGFLSSYIKSKLVQGQRFLHLECVVVQIRLTFQKFCQV